MTEHYAQRKATLKKLYDTLGDVCRRHLSIASYDTGELQTFGDSGSSYEFPLAYLETITDIQQGERKRSKTYSVALNILDREPQEGARSESVNIADRLEQTFFEILNYLERVEVFGEANIGPASVLVFNDTQDSRLKRLRGEFTIEVEAQDTPLEDLKKIFGS
ncbi:hypothetical protein [Solirubrum puertoriconensis]|uniref:Uncharacterized protein n=1 Tax=Solirubrum puertoriconensis TaxID=1751427 RepID=A0A9X0HK78_SOLP1|nr:hypothetical protein [Solirubrum puertoriconensis]KUG07430.1 hypothetical protein ASU33_13840 [Solirubrum puertoriconensis]